MKFRKKPVVIEAVQLIEGISHSILPDLVDRRCRRRARDAFPQSRREVSLMSYPETVQFFENDTLIAQAEGSPGFGPLTYNSPLTIHGAEYWTRSISVEIVAVNGNILSRMIRRVNVVKANQ